MLINKMIDITYVMIVNLDSSLVNRKKQSVQIANSEVIPIATLECRISFTRMIIFFYIVGGNH